MRFKNRKTVGLTHSSCLYYIILPYRIAASPLHCITHNENIYLQIADDKKQLTHKNKMTNLKICTTKNRDDPRKKMNEKYRGYDETFLLDR